uniref:BZIP domain-containing protein n=1 Tax=Wuchereria bancrofti TaxID=6293 RepID=A0AAF5PPY3_WUCBA
MGGASNSSSCVQATLKTLYFMLFCCCTWSTAMNIKPKKVLGVLEEAFREVLADVQNETYSITEEEEDRRRRRRRRMLQANRDMLTLMGKRKRRLKADLIKAKNNHSPSKTV